MNWLQRFRRSTAQTQANIICTFFVAVATVAYAIIAYFQLHKMGDQLQQMKRTNESNAQSSYIACVAAEIAKQTLDEVKAGSEDTHGMASASIYEALAAAQSEKALIEPSFGEPVFNVGSSIDIPIGFRNVGKTSATAVEIRSRAVFLNRASDPSFIYPKPPTMSVRAGRIPADTDVHAGGQHQVPYIKVRDVKGTIFIPSKEDSADYGSGKKDVIVFGTAEYDDPFGHHSLQFCQAKQIFIEGVVLNSGHGNCANYNKISDQIPNLKTPSHPSNSQELPELQCVFPPDAVTSLPSQ